jgi:hypothetical protein
MTARRGLSWLALATLLASGCDKTLSFDPPVDTANGGEPASGGVSGHGGGGFGGSSGAWSGHSGGGEPWQRGGSAGTDSLPIGGTGSIGNLDCPTFCYELGQRCQRNSQKCVECVDDDECEPRGLLCDRSINRCVQCTGDFACPGDEKCDGWSRRCVEPCATELQPEQECREEWTMCDARSERCVMCFGDEDCAATGDRPYCLNGGARCVQCVSDEHCWREKPNCDPVLFECVQCADSRDCDLPMVCDQDSHTCYDPRYEFDYPL